MGNVFPVSPTWTHEPSQKYNFLTVHVPAPFPIGFLSPATPPPPSPNTDTSHTPPLFFLQSTGSSSP